MALDENRSHPSSKAKIDAIRAFLNVESSTNGHDDDGTDKNGGESEDASHPENSDLTGLTCINTRPWDRQAYLERLHSYTLLGWFAKPAWLSPLHCARYGWKNTDTDLLQCVSCRAYVSGHLPSTFDPQVYDDYCGKLRDSLQSSHHPCCPWLSNPSPESFMSIPVDGESNAVTEYRARVDHLIPLACQLPQIVSETSDQIKSLAGDELQRLTEAAAQNGDMDEDIATTAVTLAICGWTCSSTKRGLIHCEFCSRTAGIWQHQPLNKHGTQPTQGEEEDEDSPSIQQVPHSSCGMSNSPSHVSYDGRKETSLNSVCDSSEQLDSERVEHEHYSEATASDEAQEVMSKLGKMKEKEIVKEADSEENRVKSAVVLPAASEVLQTEDSCCDIVCRDVGQQEMCEVKANSVDVCDNSLPFPEASALPLAAAEGVNLPFVGGTVLPLTDDDLLRSVAKHPGWDTESMEVQVSESGSVRCADIDDISVCGSLNLTETDDAPVACSSITGDAVHMNSSQNLGDNAPMDGSVCLGDVDDIATTDGSLPLSGMDGSVHLDDVATDSPVHLGDDAAAMDGRVYAVDEEDASAMDTQTSDGGSVKISDLDELSITEENASMEVQTSERGSVRIADVDDISESEGDDVDIDVVNVDDDSEMICAGISDDPASTAGTSPFPEPEQATGSSTITGSESPAKPTMQRTFSSAEITEVNWLHERSFSDVDCSGHDGLSAWDTASVEVHVSDTASVRLADLEDTSICEDTDKASVCTIDSFEPDKDDTICDESESEINTTVEEAGCVQKEELKADNVQESMAMLSGDDDKERFDSPSRNPAPDSQQEEEAVSDVMPTFPACEEVPGNTGAGDITVPDPSTVAEDHDTAAHDVVGGKRSTLTVTEERPAKKQKKKPQPFDPITEHRPWCPWATEQQLLRMSDGKVEMVARQPGWRQLLQVLLLDTSPEKSTIVKIVKTTPPREALRNIRRLFDDWTSPHNEPASSSEKPS